MRPPRAKKALGATSSPASGGGRRTARAGTALIAFKKGAEGTLPPFMAADTRCVVVEAVKKAERSGRVVVRAYECCNSRGRGRLLCARPVKQAWPADLEEKPVKELEVEDGAVRFDFQPFEILTFVLKV